MIVERTQYFAKPGLADEVLAIRRKASAVRRALGLSSGRIFTRGLGSQADSPDVVWECVFHDETEQQADLATRAASPDFEAVRATMRAAIDRFDRYVFKEEALDLASGMRPTGLRDQAIVPREIAFMSAGRELKGYLFLPPGEGPFPCLICNHGSGIEQGSLDVSRPGNGALLMSWGIASFLPHRRGYGNSPGPAWRSEVVAEFGTVDYATQIKARLDAEADDIVAALGCVSALPEIDAAHIGVMGSSFGGTTTLFAAAKEPRFTCAIDFAGAAMNWDRAAILRAGMTAAAAQVTMPLFLIQAENDYSIRPTLELAASLKDSPRPVESRVYPAFGINPNEGHLFESRGAQLWSEDVRRFLERWL
jgi:dienelactone hydrolase